MERPSKRMKIVDPDIRDPRETGSRMTEGLFTSELGIRGGDPDHELQPTRTISLADLQRQKVFGKHQPLPRPGSVARRSVGRHLFPRVPDATVTASVVEVNLNDGTTTSKVTEVPVAGTGTVVSLEDLGSLTLPGISNSTTTSSVTDSSQDTITTPPPTSSDDLTSSTSTSDLSPAGSVLSDALNGTITLSDTTTTEDHTVTVTATSTVEVSLLNGTIIVTASETSTHASSLSITYESSTHSDTFTFGQPVATSTDYGHSSDDAGSSDYIPTSTEFYGGATGVAGSPTISSSPSSSSGSGSGSGSGGGGGPSLTPQQQQVVGGVVGGIAGVALVLAIVLFVLRWYRRSLKERGQLPEQIAARELASGGGGGGNPYPMSERSSNTPFAAAMAQSLKRLRPHSNQTLATTATGFTDTSIPESERGFQRIAGRKLAPVLSTGGDPYGGNFGAFEKETSIAPSDLHDLQQRELAGASFYQDRDGFYGGKGVRTPPIPSSPRTFTGTTPATGSSSRDFAEPHILSARNSSQLSLTTPSRPDGFAVMRPSPARTPVTLSPAASSIRLPIQVAPPTMDENAPPLPMMQLDAIGRSLASQDGSRVSKGSGGRFVENMS